LWENVRICEQEADQRTRVRTRVFIREVLQMIQSKTAHNRQIATLVDQAHALELIAICHTYVVKVRGS
jgi:hypothetical protein